jgi:hypothetical protein
MNNATPDDGLVFLKGSDDALRKQTGDQDWDGLVSVVRDQLAEALNTKHVSFLFGAGTSSLVVGKTELGISTMKPLAEAFLDKTDADGDVFMSTDERHALETRLGLDLSAYRYNLESLMEVLYALKTGFSARTDKVSETNRVVVASIISKIQRYLIESCSEGSFSGGDESVLHLYETFYRKLMFRESSLPRPWVFTTNYDLFNETAMDRIGLNYCNGFSGTVERRFNPSVFRYALAEQMDITSRKWTAIDGYLYLAKLHGSISWWEDDTGLFPIRESAEPAFNKNVMIFPTPAKQHSSMASPYSDIFREFQGRITRPQSVLAVVGYGFGDQHINNIIYQALTIPTFRLIVMADPSSKGEIGKLIALGDPRIWVIGGKTPSGAKAHYFDTFVEQFMPQLPGERIEQAVKKVLGEMLGRTVIGEASANDAG